MSRGRGFTLFELMAVVAIMTILLVTVVPALDNMAPSSRLDAGGRYVAGTIEIAQSEAISQRKEFVVAYDLDNHTYWIILPPNHTRDPDQAEPAPEAAAGLPGAGGKAGDRPADDVEHGAPPPEEGGQNSEEDKDAAAEASYQDREAFEPNELPDDVRFSAVVIGNETKTSGRVYVSLDHRGTNGAHMVGLHLHQPPGGGGPQGELWLRFDPLTRTLTYSPQRPEVPTLPEGE